MLGTECEPRGKAVLKYLFAVCFLIFGLLREGLYVALDVLEVSVLSTGIKGVCYHAGQHCVRIWPNLYSQGYI